jgi:hypothetical protein
VRACFTGSAQGRSPYAKIDGYRNVWSFCSGRPEFGSITKTAARADMFQYVMMSQIDASTGGLFPSAASSPRFSLADQTAAITKAKSLCASRNPIP